MIQPHVEVPGENGHPMWKLNAFGGVIACVIGVALMITVAFFIYGVIVFAAGGAWAIVACLIGAQQEHADIRRHASEHTTV